MKSIKDQLGEILDGKYVYFRRLANEPLKLGKYGGLTNGGNIIIEFNHHRFAVPFYMVYTLNSIRSMKLTPTQIPNHE